MSRSRAVRLLGGVLVTGTAPLGIPSTGSARSRAGVVASKCGDPRTCADNRFPKVCGCDFLAGCYRDCCAPGDTCCTFPPIGAGGSGPPCEKACCPPGTRCGSSQTRPCECIGEKCGQNCCKPHQECVAGRAGNFSVSLCVDRCPQGRARCGQSTCCPPNWRCVNPVKGTCQRCEQGQEECGRRCCDRRTTRCCGNAGCCPKNRSCCVDGPNQKCCPQGQKCAPEIRSGDIGVKPHARVVCCPPERFHASPKLCCPAGTVALSGPGMQVGPGLSPYCCPRPQLCGSTCCQRSDTLGSQTCCDGRCVDTQFDPDNCGRCGNVCSSRVCSKGICAFD